MSDLDKALDLLPHGEDFRFIDRLTRLDRGKSGASEYKVPGLETAFLRGHFPGEPLFPGVLLIEAAAQLAGIIGQSDPAVAPLKNLKLTAVSRAKITGSAKPGERIIFDATLTVRMENVFQASVTATVNGAVIFRGEVTLSGDRSEAP